MKFRSTIASLILVLMMVCAVAIPSLAQGPQPVILNQNAGYAVVTFTATSQTSTPMTTGSTSYMTIRVVGSSLTTATWALKCSNDGGTSYFSWPTAAVGVPGTLALTQTSTADAMYIANISATDHCEFVTSGTFTGTNIKIKVTTSGNRGLL